MAEYPKLLFRGGQEITVTCPADEADKALEGWLPHGYVGVPDAPAVSEPATFGPADDGTGEGPTEGPADDQTHVKRARKKK